MSIGISPTGGGSLKGTGYKRVPTLSPERQRIFEQLIGGSSGGIGAGLEHLSGLAGGGDEQSWQQLEAPAMRQFNALQGNLASRYSGMGSGARNSSGFQNEASSQSQQFAESLQSKRMGFQQDAISQLLGLGQSLLGTEDTALVPKNRSFLQELLLGGSSGLSSGVGQGGMMGILKLLGLF